MNFFVSRIREFLNGTTSKDISWVTLSQFLRIALQFFYFWIVARQLGAREYGQFIGASSTVAILAYFSSMGMGQILIRNISRDQTKFKIYWGKTIFFTIFFGFCLTALVTLSSFYLIRSSYTNLLFLVAVSDFLFLPISNMCGQAYQAFNLIGKMSVQSLLPTIFRLLGALLLAYMNLNSSALAWAKIYLAASFGASLVSFILAINDLGWPTISFKCLIINIKKDLIEGFYFSSGLAGQRIYDDIDKSMLASMASPEIAGLYTVAYRMADIGYTPIRSLLTASYTKFFKVGSKGISEGLKLTKKLFPISFFYSILACFALIYFSPTIPKIFGEEYSGSVEILWWLAPLLIIRTSHSFAASILTGSDLHGMRTIVQIGASLINALLNYLTIPVYAWKGALFSTLVTEILLVMTLWCLVFIFKKRVRSLD
jgi:O-antigen/teichoic acid export membrane protein